jgi:hypothetical protein
MGAIIFNNPTLKETLVNRTIAALCWIFAIFCLLRTAPAHATPFFARTYNMKCDSCHSGFPRLNEFGLAFKANNFRIPGEEKNALLAWKKTILLAVQVKPTWMQFQPGSGKAQFTDTQLLAGGLLTQSTAFYMHHSYLVDKTPQDFPSYELWVQQVITERNKIMLKAGQFELPYAYSPVINETTISAPLLFYGSGLQGNDVALGAAMSGIQLSGKWKKLTLYLATGEPAANSSGLLIGERQFFGRFRDTYIRISQGPPDRELGLFGYFTHPTRSMTDQPPANTGSAGALMERSFGAATRFRGWQSTGKTATPTATVRLARCGAPSWSLTECSLHAWGLPEDTIFSPLLRALGPLMRMPGLSACGSTPSSPLSWLRNTRN